MNFSFLTRPVLWIIGIGLFVFIIISYCSSAYNGMVDADQEVQKQWGIVKNYYQRRFDLIPNIVETVKGYADFEKSTLENVVASRSRVGALNVSSEILSDPQKMKAFEAAQQQFQGAISRLLVVAEQYPNLKASEQFMSLQVELEGSENRIAEQRRVFNEVVKAYNTKVLRFPTNMLAGWFGFSKKEYFEGNEENEKAPSVGKILKSE